LTTVKADAASPVHMPELCSRSIERRMNSDTAAPGPHAAGIASRGNFSAESAGALASADVPVAIEHETAAQVRQRLSSRRYDIVDVVVVLDGNEHYRGAATLSEVLAADKDVPMSALVDRGWPSVGPEADQEHAVDRASVAGVSVLPVAERSGRFIGCIGSPTMLDVLAREHREDVHRLVGIMKEQSGARHALEDPPLRRVARRLPWLLVGLVLSTAGTGLMAAFEHQLSAHLEIAFFIPALVYLTDAIGTQTEAIAVRGLSLQSGPLWLALGGEMATGAIIGAVLGSLAFLGVWLFFGRMALAIGVAVSLLVAGTIASSAGLLLPWLLGRIGTDPAFGSGPVATILQDVLTLLVYFSVMSVVLPSVG
jgi:magnesium transporter